MQGIGDNAIENVNFPILESIAIFSLSMYAIHIRSWFSKGGYALCPAFPSPNFPARKNGAIAG